MLIFVVLGKGKLLFGDRTPPSGRKLVKSQSCATGVILAIYEAVGEVKTGDISACRAASAQMRWTWRPAWRMRPLTAIEDRAAAMDKVRSVQIRHCEAQFSCAWRNVAQGEGWRLGIEACLRSCPCYINRKPGTCARG